MNMSYSIVSLPVTNIGPSYAYLSGAGDLGAFWNKKSVRKRVKARKAARKAAGKKPKAGKIVGAVLTGGLSLAFGKKKKKGKTTAAPLPPVSTPAERPAEPTTPTVAEQTTTLQEQLEQQQAALPEAVAFPWIPIAIGVGTVLLIGTIAIVAKR